MVPCSGSTCGPGAQQAAEPRADAAYLPCPREKRKGIPLGLVEEPGEAVRESLFPSPPLAEGLVAGLNGVGSARAMQRRCRRAGAAQEQGDRIGVQRGRHDEDRQVIARAAHLEGEGEGKVDVHGALVELVENHQPHALQERVLLDPAGEERFSDHLDPCLPAHPRCRAHRVTGALSHALSEELGDPHGNGGGREAARLQHHDRAPRHPRLIHEIRRHQGGFPRAGLRGQDKGTPFRKEPGDPREERHERQAGRGKIDHAGFPAVVALNLPRSREPPSTRSRPAPLSAPLMPAPASGSPRATAPRTIALRRARKSEIATAADHCPCLVGP